MLRGGGPAVGRRALLAGSLALLASPGPARAEAGFLDGATVRVLLPNSPGSGSDLTSRLFVSHLARQLPNTRFSIENLTNANGRLATLYTWQAEPDGLTVTFASSSLLFAEVLGDEELPFTLEDFAWIGSLSVDRRVLLIRAASDIATPDDLMRGDRQILQACDSINTNHYREALLVNALTGSRLRPVTGFKASARALALAKGEVEALIAAFESVAPLIESGDGRVLLRLNDCRLPPPHDASPWLGALPIDPSHAWVLRLIEAQSQIGRPLATTPATPAPRLEVWRRLFDAVTADPAFVAAAAAVNFAVQPTTGEAVAAQLATTLKDKTAHRQELAALLACGEARADGGGRC